MRQQEMTAHVLMAGLAVGLPEIAVAQQLRDLLGAVVHAVDEEAVIGRRHLHGDASGVTRHHGPALPQRLGDDEPESFTERLLHDDVRAALKDVDLEIAEVGEDEDIRVGGGDVLDLFQHVATFRIVVRQRAREQQLKTG